MSDLPRSANPFKGKIERLMAEAEPSRLALSQPAKGKPNVLLVMLDDVGFGSCSTFGGPIPTPGVDRIAAAGLKYNQFHTTALCSPTRAALLTGRNHHSVHMGGITEIANSFPAYDSAIPLETATIAEILKLSGFSTGCFGKWHLTPSWEQSPAGPFDRWPTGMGFERFYGIIGAEASHWEPPVYDQTTPVQPHLDRPDYHLSEDLADQAINWIKRQKASAPDKPFFCYFAPAAVHAPHHVPEEWIKPFEGMFDQGWDTLRDEIYSRQLASGVIPPETGLTLRPEQIPSWNDYPDRYKPVASRLMEVFAGFLAHTDAQVNRLLTVLDEINQFDNTLVIYLTGDNGASAEGTVHGAWSAPSFQNGVHEDPEWLLEHMADFGTSRCENHFNVGWAWALDSPFQWMKQVASHFGGTRNALAVSWPSGITGKDELRSHFHHVIDLFPTILDVVEIETPSKVNGINQKPVQGTSMVYSFQDKSSVSRRKTQYFEILGNRGIYHDGWMASCFHGRLPWIRFAGYEFDGPQEVWELYNIEEDFSQANDLAALQPELLAELQALFAEEAERYGVYPLRDASARRGGEFAVPHSLDGYRQMTYSREHVRMPEHSIINLKNTSYAITAEVIIPSQHCQGVIACQGGNMGGWSLYVDQAGLASFVYNWFGHEFTLLQDTSALLPGSCKLEVIYRHGGDFGGGGEAVLQVNGQEVHQNVIPRTVPVIFSMSGETFDVGVDTGSPVGHYPHTFSFNGEIQAVTLKRLTEPSEAVKKAERKGHFQASLSSQ
ncbi:MAG: arylsulfatase [Gammaproteobacteria bacterium]|jgi:arylsulfatase A-like enzyme|nr:arylsulfatase [Gammaproteobacteria bacterium]MBT5204867.1 arylsulfatase [Gammaproteobacteria bacterium]MBT5603834.1 arylsulfatase [Gammaproteobacteria bacterium]MBT6246539.1 arylsulfatase [Gammaproteobacteria bacterium]